MRLPRWLRRRDRRYEGNTPLSYSYGPVKISGTTIKETAMPLSLSSLDKVIRDTYGVHMRREAAEAIVYPQKTLWGMIGGAHDQETIDAAWETLRELATTHPTVTLSPFGSQIDWDLLVVPEYTTYVRDWHRNEARQKMIAGVLAGEYDDELGV